jgi:hypothetical protein
VLNRLPAVRALLRLGRQGTRVHTAGWMIMATAVPVGLLLAKVALGQSPETAAAHPDAAPEPSPALAAATS